jgi:hypothetical protein
MILLMQISNLSIRFFVIILKLTFSKQIGMYCCILLASFIFGIKVIMP